MRSQQGFQFLLQLMVFPLIFLAGVFFPVEGVPGWLQIVAKVNPLTYGVDAIRQIFLGSHVMAETTGVSVSEGISTSIILFDHSMSVLDDVIVIAIIGSLLLKAGVWSFARTEV